MTDDPRVEAAAKALHALPTPPSRKPWHDLNGWQRGTRRDDAAAILAAADAVDPLRDDDTLHALVARGIADLYGPEPPDAEDLAEARRVVAAIRGRGRS